MSVPFWMVPLLAALVAPIACANGSNLFGLPAREETKDKIIKRSVLHVPRWKKWLIAEEHGIKNSGDIWYELSLREEDGTISAQFPSLVGPYRLSPVNQQIFACESNVMNDAKEALRALFHIRSSIKGFSEHAALQTTKSCIGWSIQTPMTVKWRGAILSWSTS